MARVLRGLGLAVSLVSLAACNLAPAYRPPVMATPPHYQPIAGWEEARPSDQAPRGDWWRVFNDPVLDGLEQQVAADNPDLAAAVARYDEASAYARQAKGALLPSVGIGGNAMANRQSDQRPLRGAGQPDNYTSDQANGAVGYELDLWGKARNQLTGRRAQAQASDADRMAMQLSLQAQLASSYFQLRGLDADGRLLAQTVEAYRKSHDLTVTLFEGKIAAPMDVSRAAVQLEAARVAQADIVARRELLVHAMAVLTGHNAADFTLAPGDPGAAVPVIPIGIPAQLLQRRPDIASAERAIAAANAAVGVSRAAFYPSIQFNALGGFESQGANPFKVGDLFWSLGPSVSLPIFDGGQRKAQLANAWARLHETSANYRSIALKAFAEVEDSRSLLAHLGEEEKSALAGEAAARQTADAAMGLYRQGAASYLEVVVAQTALLQAQQSVIDIRTRRFLATVGLIRGLGGGWRAEGATTPR